MNSAELEQLYARLEKSIFNVVFRFVWNTEEAHELVHDAFMRLWKMRKKVEMESVEALAYRIALNAARDRLRWRKVRRWLSLDDAPDIEETAANAPEQLVAAQEERRVRRAVEELPEALKDVILLTELSELSYKQVSEVLGIPPGTVGSRRNRALILLKEWLHDTEESQRSVS